jgi:hypothetical protein
MNKLHRTFSSAGVFLALLIFSAVGARAQEGHPMSGSWVGDWALAGGKRNRVVVVLEWTGQTITGVINPGPNAIPLKSASVDPTEWRLQLEAEGRDAEGQMVTYTIDGVIDDLGTYNRTLSGTWNVNSEKGDFSITRQ